MVKKPKQSAVEKAAENLVTSGMKEFPNEYTRPDCPCATCQLYRAVLAARKARAKKGATK